MIIWKISDSVYQCSININQILVTSSSILQVNKKYHELLEDLDNNFRDAINELGNDEAQTLLSNRLKAPIDIRKDGE